jgi:hypothetical protein
MRMIPIQLSSPPPSQSWVWNVLSNLPWQIQHLVPYLVEDTLGFHVLVVSQSRIDGLRSSTPLI